MSNEPDDIESAHLWREMRIVEAIELYLDQEIGDAEVIARLKDACAIPEQVVGE